MARLMKESGIPWIGKIPANWDVFRHKYVMHKEKKLCTHYKGEDIISLTMSGVIVRDLEAGGKMPSTFDGYQFVEPDNLLLCLFDIDVTPRCVGLVRNYGLTSPAYSRFIIHSDYSTAYYDYLLRSIDDSKVLVHLSKNLRSSLTESDFGMLPTIVPPSNEQKKIANFLDAECARIDAIIEQTRATVEEYKKLKQSIITQAVTKGIRPNRPMKDSGIEWIGEIPEDWDICKLRHIGFLQNGISKSSDYFGNGYPFVSYSDVYQNLSLPCEVSGLCKTTEEEQRLYSVEAGDIFFTRTSETIEEVGLSSVCEKSISKATFSGFLIRVRPYNDLLDKGFSKYYFRSEHHRFYLVKQMNLVTRASLAQPLLKGMPVLIPSKSEQLEIASFLNEKCASFDEVIVAKENILKELNSLKKSLIYEYVTGKKEA